MRLIRQVFVLATFILLPIALSGQPHAQGVQTGPGGVGARANPEQFRERMLRLRQACVGGDQGACAEYKPRVVPCDSPRAVAIVSNTCAAP